jgi:hypothetical protein
MIDAFGFGWHGCGSGWCSSLIIVKPQTVIGWHRQGYSYHFRLQIFRSRSSVVATSGASPNGPNGRDFEHTKCLVAWTVNGLGLFINPHKSFSKDTQVRHPLLLRGFALMKVEHAASVHASEHHRPGKHSHQFLADFITNIVESDFSARMRAPFPLPYQDKR